MIKLSQLPDPNLSNNPNNKDNFKEALKMTLEQNSKIKS